MKMNRVFIGSIMKCTKDKVVTIYEGGGECFDTRDLRFDVYKPHAILIKLGKGKYVDLETIESHLDYLYLKVQTTNSNKIILPTTSHGEGSLFVDEKSLRPYENIQNEKISVKRLKKENLTK